MTLQLSAERMLPSPQMIDHGGLKDSPSSPSIRRIAGEHVADELTRVRHRAQDPNENEAEVEVLPEDDKEESQECHINLVREPCRSDNREELSLETCHREALDPAYH